MTDLLNQTQFEDLLATTEGWGGSIEAGISRSFVFADYAEALRFVNRFSAIAEELFHHPDIAWSWNTVTLTITHHEGGGASAADFDLAARINQVA